MFMPKYWMTQTVKNYDTELQAHGIIGRILINFIGIKSTPNQVYVNPKYIKVK